MIFAVYDIEDNLITVCDSYIELVKFFKRTPNSMKSSVTRYFKGKLKSLICEGRHYKLYKIKE